MLDAGEGVGPVVEPRTEVLDGRDAARGADRIGRSRPAVDRAVVAGPAVRRLVPGPKAEDVVARTGDEVRLLDRRGDHLRPGDEVAYENIPAVGARLNAVAGAREVEFEGVGSGPAIDLRAVGERGQVEGVIAGTGRQVEPVDVGQRRPVRQGVGAAARLGEGQVRLGAEVVPGPSVEAAASIDGVDAAFTVELVVAAATAQDVVASPAVQEVVAAAAGEGVVEVTAEEDDVLDVLQGAEAARAEDVRCRARRRVQGEADAALDGGEVEVRGVDAAAAVEAEGHGSAGVGPAEGVVPGSGLEVLGAEIDEVELGRRRGRGDGSGDSSGNVDAGGRRGPVRVQRVEAAAAVHRSEPVAHHLEQDVVARAQHQSHVDPPTATPRGSGVLFSAAPAPARSRRREPMGTLWACK